MDLLRAFSLLLGLIVLLLFLWTIRSVLITTFLGVLFGLALSAGVDVLRRRWKIRRGLAAVLIVVLLFGLLGGLGTLIGPMLRDQGQELQRQLPRLADALEGWLGLTHAPQFRAQLTRQLGGVTRYLFPFVSGVFGAVAAVVLIVFIAIYLASQPRLYHRGVLHLFPHRMRARTAEVLDEVGTVLQRWLVARLLAMLAIGAVTVGVLLVLGVRSAVLLGVIAGLLEFIPFFGPILAAIPAVGIALVDSPQKGALVVLAFVLIQQLEGNVITPLLLQKRVDIPPALTIVTVAVMSVLFGFPGLLIAEPLLAAVLVTVKMVWVEDVVGDQIDEKT